MEGMGGAKIVGRVPTFSALVLGRPSFLDLELTGMEQRNKILEGKGKTPIPGEWGRES